MRLARIDLHPVKSTAARSVRAAYVGPAGLVGDREWMVVDRDGAMVSARELPAMLRVVADTAATGGPDGLRLSAPGHPDVEVTAVGGEAEVTVFGQGPYAVATAGPAADAWLREVLGVDGLRLVRAVGTTGRRTSERRGRQPMAFQDASPLSLATTTSAAQVGEWAGEELVVGRYRANLVVEGPQEAFAEDGWQRLRVGGAVLRGDGPIDRCVMTTVDPATLARGKEPIRTLARHRSWDGKTWFALSLRVEETGPIAVGDEVELLDTPAGTP